MQKVLKEPTLVQDKLRRTTGTWIAGPLTSNNEVFRNFNAL